ncbi:MAG TPA: AarF/UbiB family protein, partial [Pseudomonadales bacterium]|nr:AarF/UbiB family protein [Pseudomonadales bacterium]
MKRIRSGAASRQLHLANASIKAGWGWAKSQLNTLAILEEDKREVAQAKNAETYALQWVQHIGQLKGGIVKAGQILATYGDYCLPPALAKALHTLEAETEPLDWHAIAPVIQQELCEHETELEIEPHALAAASLSQVHRATILSSQESICLKILYPDIEKTFIADFNLLKASLLLTLKKQQKKAISERLDDISRVLQDEINLQIESKKMQQWKTRLADDSRFIVPRIYERYSSNNILAMSYEQGVAPHDASVLMLSQARRNQLAEAMLELLLSEILLWGEMQTDPHAGNCRIHTTEAGSANDAIVLLDFGSVRALNPQLLQPLKQMLLAAYFDDESTLREAMIAANFLAVDAPSDIQTAFSSVLQGLIEPLNYKRRLAQGIDIPANAIDEEGRYCWATARLPERMGKRAAKSAFSKHFTFPGIDFMLVARKLAGIYAFIAALDAKFDGSIVMEKVMSLMEPAKN